MLPVHRNALALFVMLMLLGTPTVGRTQAASDARTFGPTASVSHTLQAFAFAGQDATHATYVQIQFPHDARWCTQSCGLRAPLLLPAGALVTSIELEACDTNSSGQVSAFLNRIGALESGAAQLADVHTGVLPTLGCTKTSGALASPATIDNVNNSYDVLVSVDGTDNTTRFQAVRIFYHLQESPGPATATFDDVPTSHPYFQFVEALWAAGITTGCSASPPLYCPDDPLTRGQAAVFFGKALGLQFAP